MAKIMLEWITSNWMSLLALLIAALAAFFSYQQSKTAKRLAHSHIMPEVKCLFDFPVQGNPIVSVSNTGDIPTTSLSVMHNLYVYDKHSHSITSAAKVGYMFTDKMIYKKSLGPTEYVKQELVRVDPVDRVIAVYEFLIRFYRATDMKETDQRELFFVDDGKAYSHAEYIDAEDYLKIMRGIESVKIPEMRHDPGKLKTVLEALDEAKGNKTN